MSVVPGRFYCGGCCRDEGAGYGARSQSSDNATPASALGGILSDKPRRAHSVLAEGLSDLGVEHVFGLLGDGNLMLVNDLVTDWGVRYVATNREDGAVVAADGYARVSGKLGVATVTHGPGLTNTFTALVEAARARTPLLLLSGRTNPADRAHNQRLDQRATVGATGAGYVELRSADTVLDDLLIAVRQAVVESRPVVFDLPVQHQVDRTVRADIDLAIPGSPPVQPDSAALDRALGVVAVARRPVVLAGRGAVDSDARQELIRLAEQLGAPLATTLKAQGLFRDVPFDLGVFGTLSSHPAGEVISRADCVVAFGAALNRYTTSYGSFLESKTVVQVDRDPAAIGRWYQPDVGLIGDARITASLMADALESLEVKPTGLRGDEVARSLADHEPEEEFVDESTSRTIDPRTFMVWLDRAVPESRTLVCDVGGFMAIPLRYLHVAHPRAHVLPANFGAVGLGVGAAVGAGIGLPESVVLAVVGDGGFMMSGMGDLDVAIRSGIDLILVVLNNGGYDIERRALDSGQGDQTLADMPWPDPAEVGRALGAEAITVTNPSDLPGLEDTLTRRRGALVIDARITPGVV